MRCCSFVSGSKANCFYIENNNEGILVDAGLSWSKMEQTFNTLDINPKKIKSILLTHEHDDHIRYLKKVSQVLDIPVYLTQESYQRAQLDLKHYYIIQGGDDLSFGDINVHAFTVLHDSEMCLGFVFRCGDKKAFFASDIGSYDEKIMEKACNADFIGIEANYEVSMLMKSQYPQYLKDRIASSSGHLSNCEAAKFIKKTAGEKTKNVMFLHISENTNCISHIERMIDQDLFHSIPDVHYRITNRHTHGPLINI